MLILSEHLYRSSNSTSLLYMYTEICFTDSIHAHIHSGPEDGKMKRVFLVGTHMSPKNREQGQPITEDELQQIHELLKDAFYNRSGDPQCRFANHLQFPGPKNRIFAAIENSFDGSDEREDSGAEALQQKLTQTSKSLKFLKEEFPILWLRFEELLIRLRETGSTPFMLTFTVGQKMRK